MYGCNEMEIKGIETVKGTKELGESAETAEYGGDKIDPFEAWGENSLSMVARIKEYVNYYCSTDTWQIDLFCSKDFAKKRKQRGRVRCVFVGWFNSRGVRRESTLRKVKSPR
jgi:hypothetical protein